LPTITGLSTDAVTVTSDAAMIAAGIILGDVDSPLLVSATVRITEGFVAGEDLLYLAIYSGLTASWDSVNGILSISGTAPLATYQTVLRNIRYTNQADTATPGNRYILIMRERWRV
jgi:hypothetical protein